MNWYRQSQYDNPQNELQVAYNLGATTQDPNPYPEGTKLHKAFVNGRLEAMPDLNRGYSDYEPDKGAADEGWGRKRRNRFAQWIGDDPPELDDIQVGHADARFEADQEEQLQEAFEAGFHAWENGEMTTDNPYFDYEALSDEWQRGFEAANDKHADYALEQQDHAYDQEVDHMDGTGGAAPMVNPIRR